MVKGGHVTSRSMYVYVCVYMCYTTPHKQTVLSYSLFWSFIAITNGHQHTLDF